MRRYLRFETYKGSPQYEWCRDMLPVVQSRMDVGKAESLGVIERHIQQSLANCELEALRRVWVKLRVWNR